MDRERKLAIAASATALATPTRTRNPLALWHLLSLDAPTVAVVWLIFVARAERTPLPAALPACMFLAVWLVYASDRLLDTRRFAAHAATGSHRYHHTHRLAFTLAAMLAAAGIVLLLPAIPIALLGPYLLLTIVLFIWLLLIQFTRLPLPKTYAPGIFFAVAIFIPVLESQSIPILLLPCLSFAALCILNCLLIQFWQRHLQPAPAPRLRAFAFALVLAPLFIAAPISHAVSLASTALLALSEARRRLHPTTLRAAADLALLTPLLFLIF